MSPAVVLFAREPEAGRVKTPLASDLGEAAALRLYEAFLDDLARPGLLAPGWRGVVAHPGARPGPGLLRRFGAGFRFRSQGTGTPGEKLWRALAAEGAAGPGPVAVVADEAPTLSRERLEAAFDAVAAGSPVALAPAPGGGVSLLVLGNAADPGFLLGPVRWFTGEALGDVVARAKERGLEPALLPALASAGRAADLGSLARAAAGDAAPRTFGVLREMGFA